MKKNKKKPWEELKDNRCPNCGSVLTIDLFTKKLLGCSCGFEIVTKTKNLLVKRDKRA